MFFLTFCFGRCVWNFSIEPNALFIPLVPSKSLSLQKGVSGEIGVHCVVFHMPLTSSTFHGTFVSVTPSSSLQVDSLVGFHREIVLNSSTLRRPAWGSPKLLTSGARFPGLEVWPLVWEQLLSAVFLVPSAESYVLSLPPSRDGSPRPAGQLASIGEAKAFQNALSTKNWLRQLSLDICKKTVIN